MNSENFQILDTETIGNSKLKRDFLKICHQQAKELNDVD